MSDDREKNLHNKLKRLALEARKRMLKDGLALEKEVIKLLQETQKEIVHLLAQEDDEVTPYQVWRLNKLKKEIDKIIYGSKRQEGFNKKLNNLLKEQIQKQKANAEKHTEELAKLIQKEFSDAVPVSTSLFKVPTETVKFLTTYALTFSDKLSDDLVNAIKRELSLGILQGESIPKIARRIAKLPLHSNKVFRDLYSRAVAIARTETARAYTQSNLAIWQKMEVTEIKWLCGKTPCPKCEARCGRIFKREVANDIPLHPHCTCVAVPVATKNADLVSKEEREFSKRKTKDIKKCSTIFSMARRETLEWQSEKEFEKKLQKHLPKFFKVKWENLTEESRQKYRKKLQELLRDTILKASRIFYFDDIRGSGKYFFVRYKTGTIAIIDAETLNIRTFFKVTHEKGSTPMEQCINYVNKQVERVEEYNRQHSSKLEFRKLGDGKGKS
ncbi:MAG: hypothetical protein ABGX27_07955 [Desulfurobacteriaceae bacterium]